MFKSSKKSRYKYNQVAINTLSEKYGFTKNYIRGIVSGQRSAGISDKIINEYNEIARDVDKLTIKHTELK